MSNTYRRLLEKVSGAVVILALTPQQQYRAYRVAKILSKRS